MRGAHAKETRTRLLCRGGLVAIRNQHVLALFGRLSDQLQDQKRTPRSPKMSTFIYCHTFVMFCCVSVALLQVGQLYTFRLGIYSDHDSHDYHTPRIDTPPKTKPTLILICRGKTPAYLVKTMLTDSPAIFQNSTTKADYPYSE